MGGFFSGRIGGFLLRTVIAVWLPAVFVVSASAAGAVPHPEALMLPAPGGGRLPGPSLVRTLTAPGRPDWYVLPGGPRGAAGVRIDAIAVPAGCSSQRVQTTTPATPGGATFETVDEAVHVSLYNPEGHWIRAIGPSSARESNAYDLAAPYPGRYLVQIAIVDPACGGLRYRIANTYRGCGPTSPSCVMSVTKYTATAAQCNGLLAKVTLAERTLSQASRHPIPRVLRRLKGDLAAKQRHLHDVCPTYA